MNISGRKVNLNEIKMRNVYIYIYIEYDLSKNDNYILCILRKNKYRNVQQYDLDASNLSLTGCT